jgi:hypothetical protein
MQSISVHNHIHTLLIGLDAEIAAIEEEIETLIKADQEMDEN